MVYNEGPFVGGGGGGASPLCLHKAEGERQRDNSNDVLSRLDYIHGVNLKREGVRRGNVNIMLL